MNRAAERFLVLVLAVPTVLLGAAGVMLAMGGGSL